MLRGERFHGLLRSEWRRLRRIAMQQLSGGDERQVQFAHTRRTGDQPRMTEPLCAPGGLETLEVGGHLGLDHLEVGLRA